MSDGRLKIVPGGKRTLEEIKADLAELRSQARELTCLRNELRKIKPGEEYELSEASIRALKRIKKDFERSSDDD